MVGVEGFIDYSLESRTNDLAKSRGLEVFDYDDDGDLDMIVANTQEKPYLYRNNIISGFQPDSANWIRIWLEGTVTNRDAFGTEVKITIDGDSYYRWHHGAGYLSQSIKPVHFGLVSETIIDEIQVTWLSGLVQKFENVNANKTIRIIEGSVTTAVTDEIIENYAFQISNCFPNPFHNSINIRFLLNQPGNLDFRIFSLSGTQLYTHRQKILSPGPMELSWNGLDRNGHLLPEGIYLYTADFNGQRLLGKLVKVVK